MTIQPQASPTQTAALAFDNAWLQWRPEAPSKPQILTVADLAECVCPDLCDRDHPNE